MIVWTGRGFLVPIVAFLCALIANAMTEAFTGHHLYWQRNSWPLGAALLAAGAFAWFYGKHLRERGGRLLRDERTGQQVEVGGHHSLFFIRMEIWGPILGVFGIFNIVKNLVG